MKILYVSSYAPERDGIGDYTAGLAGAVDTRGHDVRVVAVKAADGAPPEVIGSLPRTRAQARELRERIENWNPDVVHVQFAVATYGGRVPALLRLMNELRDVRARRVVTLHEVTRDTASLRVAGRALYRRIAEWGDVALVHTKAARDTLSGPVGFDAERVALVPHPRRELPHAAISQAALRERHGLRDARVLLALGFVHVDKGLPDLVEALDLLTADSESGDVRLVVAGDVRTRAAAFKPFEWRDRAHLLLVRRAIRRAGLQDRVVLTGYVPEGEMKPWLELAEAAVLPYRRIEQSGIASLAASAGTPVLASEVGGLGREFSGERWQYPARDPERLAGVLRDFLNEDAGARRPTVTEGQSPNLGAVADATLALYGAPAGPLPRTAPETREVAHVA
jgi:glycosyltransferase involved in cell wall biosynthesis